MQEGNRQQIAIINDKKKINVSYSSFSISISFSSKLQNFLYLNAENEQTFYQKFLTAMKVHRDNLSKLYPLEGDLRSNKEVLIKIIQAIWQDCLSECGIYDATKQNKLISRSEKNQNMEDYFIALIGKIPTILAYYGVKYFIENSTGIEDGLIENLNGYLTYFKYVVENGFNSSNLEKKFLELNEKYQLEEIIKKLKKISKKEPMNDEVHNILFVLKLLIHHQLFLAKWTSNKYPKVASFIGIDHKIADLQSLNDLLEVEKKFELNNQQDVDIIDDYFGLDNSGKRNGLLGVDIIDDYFDLKNQGKRSDSNKVTIQEKLTSDTNQSGECPSIKSSMTEKGKFIDRKNQPRKTPFVQSSMRGYANTILPMLLGLNYFFFKKTHQEHSVKEIQSKKDPSSQLSRQAYAVVISTIILGLCYLLYNNITATSGLSIFNNLRNVPDQSKVFKY